MGRTILKSFIFSSYSIFSLFSILAHSSSDPCAPATCDDFGGPLVRFPFRLKGRQPAGCGYPGFDLQCNFNNQTILDLPRSGPFKVDYIDYTSQALFINDPGSCLPGRIMNFSLLSSPFEGAFSRRYDFYNCSSNLGNYSGTSPPLVRAYCLSGSDYTVVAARSRMPPGQLLSSCRRIGGASVPLQWSVSQFYWASLDLTEDLELVWRYPDCWGCENRGGICGFKGGSGKIGCSISSRSGLPRSAKYGILIGVGIPALLCIIGLASYVCGMIKARSRSNTDHQATRVSQPDWLVIRRSGGLDMPTIASYPKVVLGESCRLPDPTNAMCPICLCEYQPKEALRSIPECNHYFHSECIDEWLKLNGTCPLCRNSPPTSTATPSSTMSLSSSSTPSDRS